MPLSSGDRVGHYKILSMIGKGGMGEVYRALDSKLERDVAIKVLPDAVAADPERLARFEREARVLASLNHPGIASIYGVEDRALVMELVPGPTLAERIEERDGKDAHRRESVVRDGKDAHRRESVVRDGKGAHRRESVVRDGKTPQDPIPAAEAEEILLQIAEALEYAHERGIVHRDLKPANIKIDLEDKVKILDFGLAKAFTDPVASPSDHPTDSPTVTMGATIAGTILGTAAYMAPEQARGKRVDKRADIWAFGVVAWEMLTGERLFRGETTVEVLGKVLEQKPDLDRVPAKFRKLLARCLERNPKDRLRDIGEARFLLEEPAAQAAEAVAPQLPASRFTWIPWAAAGVAILAAATLGWIAYRATRPAPLKPMVRLDVDLGSDVSLQTRNGSSNVVISPDGSRLVYLASVGGGAPSLYIRRFDQPRGTELPGTQGAQSPFFSPDGQWVGFTANAKLGKISVEGGAAVPLRNDAPSSTGASWGEGGTILYALLNRGLFLVPAAGGDAAPLLELANRENALIAPQILPGSKAILFTAYTTASGPDTDHIDVFRLSDRSRKTLARGGLSGRYLPASDGAGYLLYANKSTLFAAPFDLGKLETRGPALPVLDDVAYNPRTFESQFDVSRGGTLVYLKTAGGNPLTTLQWLDVTGKRQSLAHQPGAYGTARLSPDGKRLAVSIGTGAGRGIQVYDLQRDTWSNLTPDSSDYDSPVWSPDGRYVVFGSSGGLLWTRADGSGQPQPLTSVKGQLKSPTSISPDGRLVAYFEVFGLGHISTVPVEENGAGWKAGTPQRFAGIQGDGENPTFSPDGKWLAYQSNTSDVSVAKPTSTCGRFRTMEDCGRSRPMAEPTPYGRAPRRSCSTRPATRSWPSAIR